MSNKPWHLETSSVTHPNGGMFVVPATLGDRPIRFPTGLDPLASPLLGRPDGAGDFYSGSEAVCLPILNKLGDTCRLHRPTSRGKGTG